MRSVNLKEINIIIFICLFFGCEKDLSKFHENAFVADTHNDVLLRSMIGRDILTDLPESHSDLPKFKSGGMDCQVFSIWVSPFEFKDGEYHGQGKNYLGGKLWYEGQWKSNSFDGEGTLYFNNGEKYRGKWEKDQAHKIGELAR